KLVATCPKALRDAGVPNPYDPMNLYNLRHVTYAYQKSDQFDIIHDHTVQNSPLSLPLATLSQTPSIMTLHGPISQKDVQAFETFRKPYIATLSKAQARVAPQLHYAGTVYNGLFMEEYPFSQDTDGYLLVVARVHLQNGIEE